MRLVGKIILVSSLIVLCFSKPVAARACYCGDCSMKNIVGEVIEIDSKNKRIYVREDNSRIKWDFFVHEKILKDFKKGDHVRIYYECPQSPAVSVAKMRPVQYKKDPQNGGYLLKSDKAP